MAKKRKNPNPMNASFKFDRSVDIGPQDYKEMGPDLAQTIQDERIRRQVQSRMGVKPKKRKFYDVVE